MPWLFEDGRTGEIFEMDEDFDEKSGTDLNKQAAIAKGHKPVQALVDPKDGSEFYVDESDFEYALKKGYKTPENAQIRSQVAQDRKQRQESQMGTGLAMAKGFADTATYGFSDEIGGAWNAITGQGGYKDTRDYQRELSDVAKDKNTGAYYTGMAGAILPTFGAAATKAPTLANAVKMGAAEGAAFGAGDSRADLTEGDVGGVLADTAVGATVGAAIPVAMEGVKKGVQAAAKPAGWLGKKIGRVLTGVQEADVDHYVANRADVNASKSYEEIKDLVDAGVSKFDDAVDAGKEAVDAARFKLAETAAESKYAVMRAKEALKSTRPPEQMQAELIEAVSGLDDAVRKASSDAFDLLEKGGTTFDVRALQEAAAQQLDNLMIGGKPPTTGPDAAAFSQIKQFMEGLEQYIGPMDLVTGARRGDVSASTVKQLIQNLDRTSKAAYTDAGQRGPLVAESFAKVRRSFDAMLKQSNKDYEKAMEPLAEQTQLLSQLSEMFGEKGRAMANLRLLANSDSPAGAQAKQLLAQLDQTQGTNFTGGVQDYLKAQATVKSPTAMKAFEEALPESQAYRVAQEGVQSAQEKLAQAKAAKEPFSRLGPNNTESQIKQVAFGRNIEGRRALEALGEQTGDDYTKMIRDTKVKDAFTKENTQGSRMTLLGAMFGGPIGAAMGASGDRFASRMYKGTIDFGMDFSAKVSRLPPKYQQAFQTAAQRGGNATAVTHFLLSNQDPEYRKLMEDED